MIFLYKYTKLVILTVVTSLFIIHSFVFKNQCHKLCSLAQKLLDGIPVHYQEAHTQINS